MLLDMYKGVANSPETTITNNINNTDTIIYVLDETRIPEDLPNLMVLGTGVSAETIKVLSIEGNAITVERGFQGIPRAWNAGTIIARNFTEYDYNALVENVKTLKGNTDTNAGDILSLMNYVGNLESLDTVEKSNIVLALNEIYQDLIAHKADFTQHLEANNPHGITKTIVGLNSVQNYGIATQSEAEVGTSNVKYMTPLRVKESINALAISKSVEGAYTGDGTNGRVINIGFRPKLVFIREGTSSTSNPFAIYSSIGIIYVPASVTVCRPFDSNYNFISDVGFGVSKSSAGFNVSGNSYTYYAIG